MHSLISIAKEGERVYKSEYFSNTQYVNEESSINILHLLHETSKNDIFFLVFEFVMWLLKINYKLYLITEVYDHLFVINDISSSTINAGIPPPPKKSVFQVFWPNKTPEVPIMFFSFWGGGITVLPFFYKIRNPPLFRSYKIARTNNYKIKDYIPWERVGKCWIFHGKYL